MKKNKNSRGVITVLLIIILIPMLLVTSVFVDASRYKLVKSMVTSTSDLTLNSVIANYDTELDDMYGLFGTVQNIDEFYEELEEYFKIMLMQSGLDESISEDTSLFLTNGVKNGDFSNFFEMEFLDDVSIEEVPNGNLANPVILEKQIVDFMKYRSPINTGLSFITALQSFKTIEDQKKVVEAKDEYYKDVSKINKALRDAWQEICYYSNGSYWLEGEYQYYEYIDLNSAPEKISQADYIKSISEAFKNYRQEYEICNKEFFLNIASNKYYNTDISVKNPSASSQKSEKITQSIADKLYKEINKSIGDFKSALGECKKDMQSDNDNDNSFKLDYNPSHGYYPTQVWLKNNYSNRISDFALHYNTLCTHYTAYLNNRAKADALKTENEEDEELIKKCKAALDSYDCDDEFKKINNAVNDLNTKLNSYRNYYITNYKKSENEISNTINRINKEIIDIKSDLNTAYTHLDNAVNYLDKAVGLMDADLATKKNNWKQAAEKIDGTTIGQENLSEISGLNDEYINKDTVNKFIKYLEAIRDNIGGSNGVIKQIEDITFCGKQLGDITANISSQSDPTKMVFTNLIIQKYGSNNLKNMPTTKDEIETIAKEFFARKDVYKESTISTDWLSSDYNPTIGENNYSNNLNFYNYLSNQFGDLSIEDTTTKVESIDTDTKLNEANAKGNPTETEVVTNPEAKADVSSLKVIKKGDSFDGGGAEGENANSRMKNAKLPSSGSLFSDLVNGLERLRDKMYVTDYVMSMFSYATIESELAKENEKNNTINSTDPTSSSTNTKDGKPQSLTFQEINADNNKIYPYEAEYIVYGKDTNSSNYNATCASIFGVRFMFNLIYAFTSSQLKMEALPIAAGLSAATLGIVPVEVFKIVILLVDAIVESGIDLYEIKKGESLPLYKTKETWQTSYASVIRKEAGKILTTVVDEATGMIVDCLNKTIDEASETLEEEETIIDNYLKEYFDSQINNITKGVIDVFFSVYDAAETTVLTEYGKITDLAKEKIISEVSNSIDKWASQNNNEKDRKLLIVDVKTAVAENIKQYLPALVERMVSLGQSKINETSNNIKEKVEKEIKDIASDIENVIERTKGTIKTEIDNYKEQFLEEIKESVSQGGEELKKTINSSISSYFGNGSGGNNVCSNAESLLSFKYSDYLRFFAMCSVYSNEEGFITRVGNLIQTNMNIQATKNSKTFDLNKSRVYLKVNTTIKVKPLLINLDIFNTMINADDNGLWGKYDFVTVKGY